MKKILLLALTALTLCSCGGGFTKTLTFTRDEIQSKVEEKFPIKRSAAVVELELTNPGIVLEDGSDLIGLKADAEARLPGSGIGGLIGLGGEGYDGTIYIEGDVDYDPDEGTFYFTHGKVKELKIASIPDELSQPVTKLADAAANNNLSKVPLFTLNTKDMKEKAAKFLLKKVRVKNGKLEVIVGL